MAGAASASKSELPVFRIRSGEPVPRALRRIVAGELDAMQSQLAGAPSEGQVHDLRKATKRLRALLRLLRSALPKATYRRELTALRQLAHHLDAPRSAAILLQQAERLARDAHLGTMADRQQLARHLRDRAGELTGAGVDRVAVAALLQGTRERAASWTDLPDRWRTLAPGVRRVYRRARETGRRAASSPTVEHLHDWRKRVQDLRFAMELLTAAWPTALAPLATTLHRLGDLLGDDHDLAMLVPHLRHGDGTRRRWARAESLLRRRRRVLQARAWRCAAGVFTERPRVFARHLRDCWRISRA